MRDTRPPAKLLAGALILFLTMTGPVWAQGAVADLTIFDPETVTENATPTIGENSLPFTGIPYVIVNGQVVVDKSEVLNIPAGVAIRNPIID